MAIKQATFRKALLTAIVITCYPKEAFAGPPLETETARLLAAGTTEVQAAFEYQTSKEGSEWAIPLEFEYGITNDLQLLIEPVVFTAIVPNQGKTATGLGDLETTLFYKFVDETDYIPALAIAGEIKFPTAYNRQIGTGQTDFTPYIIASKRFGDFDTHINLGYTFLGQPNGVSVKNTFSYAFATEYYLTQEFQLVAEILGNTSAINGANEGDAPETPLPSAQPGRPTAAEVAGQEIAGLVGFRYDINPSFNVSLGVTYDNQHAVLFRPGLAWEF